ncbi:IS66 family insertion sequence element accessory protein TnpB, partial [Mangrovicoccus sp. HB161399]|uniref:IS66 family insertion sequence element accessory protein TnpB n=1 Tax=Mangrovicoccus sp. HB161399 TaxID=2720392 RepID=UPI001C12DB20
MPGGSSKSSPRPTSHTVLPDDLGGIITISVRGSFLDADHPRHGIIFACLFTLLKILWHDGVGMSFYSKRLEAGKFIWPVSEG